MSAPTASFETIQWYICTKCQENHYEKMPVYEKHKTYQSEVGIQQIPRADWLKHHDNHQPIKRDKHGNIQYIPVFGNDSRPGLFKAWTPAYRKFLEFVQALAYAATAIAIIIWVLLALSNEGRRYAYLILVAIAAYVIVEICNQEIKKGKSYGGWK